MPMFPDSGVPPGDAKNSLPDVNTANCPELWYSTSRCQPRFDPAAANAMLAEDMNLIMKGELQYDCNRLDHIERAVRYIAQRGLARAAYLTNGPNNYLTSLDPACTRYNNFLTLTVVTDVTNQAVVTVNINGLGAVYILRNDGRQLERADLLAGIPYIIAFINGYFYVCGLVASQVPLLVKGGIDCWIRTDGNDLLGDGTANTPDKAFKTIAGCWNAVGSRYAATPLFSINMKFGIPGTYDGTSIGQFGGAVSLTGDQNNPGAYRIRQAIIHPDLYTCMWMENIASMTFLGVTFELSHPGPEQAPGVRAMSSKVHVIDCRFEVMVSNPRSRFVDCAGGGEFSQFKGNNRFIGNNHTIGGCVSCYGHGFVGNTYLVPGETGYWHFENIHMAAGSLFFWCTSLGVQSWGGTNIYVTNCTGIKYFVAENAVINMNGFTNPGNLPGSVGSGGQYLP